MKKKVTDKPIEEHIEDVAPEEVEVDVQKEVEEYKNLYLRALADYKNLEHRVNQDRRRMRIDAKKQIIMQLLPLLDNIDQAEVFTKDPGLQLISSSFHKAVEEMGVSAIELVGSEFNPEVAEAVQVVPGKKDNLVVDVLQKAYMLDGQVIRHARVTVSRKDGS